MAVALHLAINVENKLFIQNILENNYRFTRIAWWPCLLMDRDKMSNLYRGPSIDASYQVSVHLAEGLQRRLNVKS
jgi:hypothetical protein